MKVSPTGPNVTGEVAAEKKRNPGSPGEGSFETLLNQAVTGASKGDVSSAPMKTVTYPGTPGILSVGSDVRMETLSRADKLLSILDDYSAKLADPRCSLREIHELVVGMETEKDLLLPLMESLPAGDSARELLNRILVTASVESIKFNRGDYLP